MFNQLKKIRNGIRALTLILSLTLILTSCSSNSESNLNQTLTREIPAGCESTKMLEAFLPDVANPKYIPTKWQPAAGTDLAIVLSNGGIACTYGVAEIGVGATVYWTKNKNMSFEERVNVWKSKGFTKFDIPNLDEDDSYISLNSSEVAEIDSAAINFLVDGIWIQINCSWAYTEKDLLPLIDKAVASTISS